MRQTFFVVPLLLMTLLLFHPAEAVVLTDSSQLTAGNTMIDFEAFPAGPVSNPFVVGAATFSAALPLRIEDITGFGANGTEVFHHTLRTNGAQALGHPNYVDIRIDFADLVSEVGLGWFDPNFAGNELRVFNSSNTLLESAPIPTNPAGGGFAAFRGIRRDANEIAYAIAKVASAGDVYSLDNVSFGAHGIPEPASILLLWVAGGIACLAPRRRY